MRLSLPRRSHSGGEWTESHPDRSKVGTSRSPTPLHLCSSRAEKTPGGAPCGIERNRAAPAERPISKQSFRPYPSTGSLTVLRSFTGSNGRRHCYRISSGYAATVPPRWACRVSRANCEKAADGISGTQYLKPRCPPLQVRSHRHESPFSESGRLLGTLAGGIRGVISDDRWSSHLPRSAFSSGQRPPSELECLHVSISACGRHSASYACCTVETPTKTRPPPMSVEAATGSPRRVTAAPSVMRGSRYRNAATFEVSIRMHWRPVWPSPQ